MTGPDCEAAVKQVLIEAGLRPHPFFIPPPRVAAISPQAGWEVARTWQEMTRTFMLTTIASLGVLAAELAAEPEPAVSRLTALQTGYRVIGDDLINIDPIFAKTAPDGPTGIHYMWWDETILAPVTAALPVAPVVGSPMTPGVQALLDNMARLARSPIGAAVQLRVVEDIALDIATAFRNLFRQVTADGAALFGDGDLGWMDAHIEAEVVHQASVSDHETGMTTIAVTPAEQRQFLTATTEYAVSWARALDDLAAMPANS